MEPDTRAGDSQPGPIHELFARYIDRLNASELLDPEEIRREHPAEAEALIRQLRDFEAFGSSDSSAGVSDSFGPYRIVREIGRGGMGIVYEAFDPEMERRAALKVLSAGLAVDDRSIHRFRREARIVGKLHHPAIVGVYATGIERGTPYIAMELVEGESLEKILERKRPRPGPARGWSRRVLSAVTRSVSAGATTVATPAEALPYAVPPAEAPPAGDSGNLTPIPATTEDMDLGYSIRMAKMFAAVAEGLEHAHSQNVVHRDIKPSNLILDRGRSPERNDSGMLRILDFGLARLEGQDRITGSGEILGTPRYMSPEQARASRIPIDHRTDIYSLGATLYEVLTLTPPVEGRTAQETILRIIRDEPRSPREINPRIPRDLETIVLKCMRKDPAERYPSAGALAEDLLRFSRGDPIRARPRSLVEKTVWWVRRNGARLGVAAVVLIAAVLGWTAWREYTKRTEVAVEKREIEYEDLVTEAAIRLQRSGALAERAGFFAWEGASYDPMLLGEGLDQGYSVSGHVLEAVAILERAIAAVPNRPIAYFHLSRALAFLGENDRAMETLDRAIALGFVPALAFKASIHEYRGEREKAAAVMEEARSSGEEWVGDWLDAQHASARGEWREAIRAFRKLIAREEVEGRSSFLGSAVEFYLGAGVAHLQLGEHDEARACFAAVKALRPGAVEPELFIGISHHLQGARTRALEVFEALYARNPSNDVANLLALLHWARFQDFENGLRWAERVEPGFFRELWRTCFLMGLEREAELLEAAERLPELNPNAGLGYFLAALAFTQAGQLPRGEELARRACVLAPKSCAPRLILANVLRLQGKFLEAFAAIQEAAKLEPDSPEPKFFMGMALASMGRTDESIALLEDAIERAGSARLHMLRLEVAHRQLAEIHSKRGDTEKARHHLLRRAEIVQRDGTASAAELAAIAQSIWETGGRLEALEVLDGALDHPSRTPEEARVLLAAYSGLASGLLPDLPGFRAVEAAIASAGRDDLVPEGAEWRYREGTSAPGEGIAWALAGFDESGWKRGASGFGYGDEDDATLLEGMEGTYSTVYARTTFDSPPRGGLRRLVLSVRADDGFVAWLNGREVGRVRAGTVAVPPHDGFAAALAPEPLEPVELEIDPEMLEERGNVLALVGLNASLDSSDFTLAPVLRVERDPDRGELERLLEAFRAAARGPDAGARIAYLRGRILEISGDFEAAAAELRTAAAGGEAAVLPRAALARCLRAAGKPQEAAKELRRLIETRCPGRRDDWELWLAISFGALGLSAEAVAGDLPCARFEGRPGTPAGRSIRPYLDDLRWLLERVCRSEPLRINCGGAEHRDGQGATWSEDRFFCSGAARGDLPETVGTGIEELELYASERYFPQAGDQSGYRVPLPAGSWRVTLHFAEVRARDPAQHVFDVLLEGIPMLEEFRLERFGETAAKSFHVDVEDGLLEIEFRDRLGLAKVSAIEIEPR